MVIKPKFQQGQENLLFFLQIFDILYKNDILTFLFLNIQNWHDKCNINNSIIGYVRKKIMQEKIHSEKKKK